MLRCLGDQTLASSAPKIGGASDASNYIPRISEAAARTRLLPARDPVMPDGVAAVDHPGLDGHGREHILINTAEDRQNERNVRRDPRVAVNVVDLDPAKRGVSLWFVAGW
jgi:hypothetical protein